MARLYREAPFLFHILNSLSAVIFVFSAILVLSGLALLLYTLLKRRKTR